MYMYNCCMSMTVYLCMYMIAVHPLLCVSTTIVFIAKNWMASKKVFQTAERKKKTYIRWYIICVLYCSYVKKKNNFSMTVMIWEPMYKCKYQSIHVFFLCQVIIYPNCGNWYCVLALRSNIDQTSAPPRADNRQEVTMTMCFQQCYHNLGLFHPSPMLPPIPCTQCFVILISKVLCGKIAGK